MYERWCGCDSTSLSPTYATFLCVVLLDIFHTSVTVCHSFDLALYKTVFNYVYEPIGLQKLI